MFNAQKYKIGKLYRIGSVFIENTAIKAVRVFSSNEMIDEMMKKNSSTGLTDGSIIAQLHSDYIETRSVVMIVDVVSKLIATPTPYETMKNLEYRYYYKVIAPTAQLFWVPETFLSELDA
jgi:hypothetical protein